MKKNVSISFTSTYADGEYYTDWITYYAQDDEVIFGGERRGFGVGAMVVQEEERSLVHAEACQWFWDTITALNENCTIEVTNKESVVLIDIIHQRYQE